MKTQISLKTKASHHSRRKSPLRPKHSNAWSQWLAQLKAQQIDPTTILSQLSGPEVANASLTDIGWSPAGDECYPVPETLLFPDTVTQKELAEPSESVTLDLFMATGPQRVTPKFANVCEFRSKIIPSLISENYGGSYQECHLQDNLSIQNPLSVEWVVPTLQKVGIPDPSLETTDLHPLTPQSPQISENIGCDYQESPLQDNLPIELPQEIPEEQTKPAEFFPESWFQSKSQTSDSPDPPRSFRGLNTSSVSLPFKSLLESRLGQSLSTLQVFAGTSEVRAILAQFQAIAAHYNGQLLFAEAQPSLETVTHEVIHALQTRSGNTINNKPVLIQSSTAAEQEATNLAAVIDQSVQPQVNTGLPWAVISVRASLSADAIACLRDAPPATASPAASPESIFETITNSYDLSPISDGNSLTPVRALASSSEPAETESALEADITPPQINVLEEVPTLEPPAPLEPGITPENVTAREASRATAEAKLANAKDVDKKVDAYAAAPPSVKAQSYGSLGSDLSALTQAESESFQEKIPEFQAKLSGETESLPKLQVESPPAEDVALEDTPDPAPDPEIPPTPEATPYTGNNSILRTIARLSEGTAPQDRASEIGNTLRNVRTTDPEVETTPGPPPAIPLEEETDPERIPHQIEAGKELATQARDQAQQAVINGPGPEQVQPVVMDESVPLEELAQMELTQPAPVPGVDEFSQREMPPEVITAFDQNNQDTMQASLAEAQAQVQQTTDERDLNRQEQLDTAQAEADRQTEQADQDQRDAVQTQRERIQDERQHTLEEQTQAVRNVESQTEARRREDQEAIEGRVRQDEDTIRENYNQAERNAAAEVRDGERQAEDKRREAEQKAKNQSWWDRAVNFVQRAFEALTSAIGAIFDAVRSAVNAILNAVKAAAEALIKAATNFIKNAIALFGDFLKKLVDGLLGDLFPGLAAALNSFIDDAVQLALQAVNAVAETLRNGIKALVEGLRAGLNAVLNALQTGLEFAANLIQTALSGDWGAVIRLLLEAVLKVVGIEPETFYGFIGRAEDMFKRILDNPGAVVSNLLKAVTQGIQNFADNFSTHLQRGIIGWLAGTLGSNLQIPTDFSLLGVLDLARQIMGLTLQFIRRIAVRLIGEENVERIEAIFEYVQTLITGGWSALFEQITESLGNVRDMVMEQIKEFLVTRLILAAITKLVSLFNPIGAIVQLVLTIWNIFTFLRENLQRLIQIVQTIVNSLSQIVQGVIGKAASSIETVLANLLPVAISFLANLLGIGGIANRVRCIIDGLRDRIENAIVNFIRRIASRFTGRGRGRSSKTNDQPQGRKDQKQDIAVAQSIVKDTLATQLPKGASQLADVSKVLAGVASKVKPTFISLQAAEVLPGKPKTEGAISFKVKGKSAEGKDILITSVRYSAEGKALSHEERWKAGVKGVKRAVKQLESRSISEETIKAQFSRWCSEFGFNELILNKESKHWQIEGSMSNIQKVTEVSIPRTAKLKEAKQALKQVIEELISSKFNNTRDAGKHFSKIKSRYHMDEIKWKHLGQPTVSIELKQQQAIEGFDDKSILEKLNLSEPNSTNVELANKGRIEHTPGTIKIPYGSHPVGQKMIAILTSNPKIENHDTSQLNGVMKYLPTAIKKYARQEKVNKIEKRQFSSSLQYVAGHLLNHRLGGKNEAKNLFPITQQANKEHELEVESKVKDWTKKDKYFLRYTVSVETESIDLNENPKARPEEPKGSMIVNAKFKCNVVVYTATGSDGDKKIEDKEIISRFLY